MNPVLRRTLVVAALAAILLFLLREGMMSPAAAAKKHQEIRILEKVADMMRSKAIIDFDLPKSKPICGTSANERKLL